MSIHPKWCKKIFNGEKTIEVRKTAPKPPFKVVVYCTKGDYLVQMPDKKSCRIYPKREYRGMKPEPDFMGHKLNGKVIGEFICDKVDFVAPWGIKDIPLFYSDKWVKEILKKACLTCDEAIAYQGNKSDIYALHITAPVLYDKPKELGEFRKPCGDCIGKCTGEHYERCPWQTVTRPPQSYMRIEEV